MGDPRVLLDPRWHWLRQAAERLYATLDPSDQIGGLTMAVIADDGVILALLQNEPGAEIIKQIVTDESKVAEYGTDILDNRSVNLAVQ